MLPRKSDCRVHRVKPLKESENLKMGCAASQAGLSHAAQTDIIGKGDVDEPTISASLDPIQYRKS